MSHLVTDDSSLKVRVLMEELIAKLWANPEISASYLFESFWLLEWVEGVEMTQSRCGSKALNKSFSQNLVFIKIEPVEAKLQRDFDNVEKEKK